jgi:hypothetical protein
MKNSKPFLFLLLTLALLTGCPHNEYVVEMRPKPEQGSLSPDGVLGFGLTAWRRAVPDVQSLAHHARRGAARSHE